MQVDKEDKYSLCLSAHVYPCVSLEAQREVISFQLVTMKLAL